MSTDESMKKRKRLAVFLILIIAIPLYLGYLTSVGLLIWYACDTLPKLKQDKEREAQVEAYIEEKLQLYREENAAQGAEQVEVVFLGDSLTDGYDIAAYYPQYVTRNRGIGGDTTARLKNRMQVSAYDVHPKVVVMLIGANNMDTMMEDYATIVSGLKENLPNSHIVLLSLTSMSGEWGRKNQLAAYNNVLIRKVAEDYGCEYVDLYYPLLDADTGELKAEYSVDGGHLTAAGYAVVTATVTPVLQRLLGH